LLFQDVVAVFSVPGLSQTRQRQGQLFGAGDEAEGLGDLDPALGVPFGVVLVRQFGEADAGKVVEHGSLQGGRLRVGVAGDG